MRHGLPPLHSFAPAPCDSCDACDGARPAPIDPRRDPMRATPRLAFETVAGTCDGCDTLGAPVEPSQSVATVVGAVLAAIKPAPALPFSNSPSQSVAPVAGVARPGATTAVPVRASDATVAYPSRAERGACALLVTATGRWANAHLRNCLAFIRDGWALRAYALGWRKPCRRVGLFWVYPKRTTRSRAVGRLQRPQTEPIVRTHPN